MQLKDFHRMSFRQITFTLGTTGKLLINIYNASRTCQERDDDLCNVYQ